MLLKIKNKLFAALLLGALAALSFPTPSTAAGGNDPVETAAAPEEDYRTLMILPKKLIIKLRKIAVHRDLIENQLVTVNDIISRILRTEFARSGE